MKCFVFALAAAVARAQVPNRPPTYVMNRSTIIMCVGLKSLYTRVGEGTPLFSFSWGGTLSARINPITHTPPQALQQLGLH